MEINGLVTVRAAVPETEPEVAVMVTLPGATPVARPPAPIAAIRLFVDCQVALAVMSCVAPLARVAMAVNCWVLPGATGVIDTELGVTAIETTGLVTVNTAVPEMEPEVAVMVEVAPAVLAVAKPPEVIVAPALADQATVGAVRTWVLPSL